MRRGVMRRCHVSATLSRRLFRGADAPSKRRELGLRAGRHAVQRRAGGGRRHGSAGMSARRKRRRRALVFPFIRVGRARHGMRGLGAADRALCHCTLRAHARPPGWGAAGAAGRGAAAAGAGGERRRLFSTGGGASGGREPHAPRRQPSGAEAAFRLHFRLRRAAPPRRDLPGA